MVHFQMKQDIQKDNFFIFYIFSSSGYFSFCIFQFLHSVY